MEGVGKSDMKKNIKGQVKGTLNRFEYELICFTASCTFKLVGNKKMELLITIYGNKWGLGVLGCISAAMDV